MFINCKNIILKILTLMLLPILSGSCSSLVVVGERKVSTRLRVSSFNDSRVQILRARSLPEAKRDGEVFDFRSDREIYSGLDQLAAVDFEILRDRKFALLSNGTGRSRDLKTIIDLLLEKGSPPALVLEPEHGLFGSEDEHLKDGIRTDPRTNLKIYSLYSADNKKPSRESLQGIEIILVDLQTLPVRCYTYISTLELIFEAAVENNIEVIILDRPNPYGFWDARGPLPQEGYRSFISQVDIPFLYSMTPGEYGLYAAAEKFKSLRLKVIPVKNFRRRELSDNLSLAWVNPSPAIPSLESAVVYSGMVFLEGIEISLGRGTSRPFLYSGAPWLKSHEVAAELRRLKLPGVEIGTVVFKPSRSNFEDENCYGLQFHPVDDSFDPIRTAYEYMRIIKRLHPKEYQLRRSQSAKSGYFLDLLWGGPGFRLAIEKDREWVDFNREWSQIGVEFERKVKPYRLYGR